MAAEHSDLENEALSTQAVAEHLTELTEEVEELLEANDMLPPDEDA